MTNQYDDLNFVRDDTKLYQFKTQCEVSKISIRKSKPFAARGAVLSRKNKLRQIANWNSFSVKQAKSSESRTQSDRSEKCKLVVEGKDINQKNDNLSESLQKFNETLAKLCRQKDAYLRTRNHSSYRELS